MSNDREGMAAEFLSALVAQGRTVVTILQSEQYEGLASWSRGGDLCAAVPGPCWGGDARGGERSLCPALA